MKFEVLAGVLLRATFFWEMTPCELCRHQCFRELTASVSAVAHDEWITTKVWLASSLETFILPH